jgi:hypothetical protein
MSNVLTTKSKYLTKLENRRAEQVLLGVEGWYQCVGYTG